MPLFLRLNQEMMVAMAHIDLRDQPAIGCIFSRYEYRVNTRESTHIDIPSPTTHTVFIMRDTMQETAEEERSRD